MVSTIPILYLLTYIDFSALCNHQILIKICRDVHNMMGNIPAYFFFSKCTSNVPKLNRTLDVGGNCLLVELPSTTLILSSSVSETYNIGNTHEIYIPFIFFYVSCANCKLYSDYPPSNLLNGPSLMTGIPERGFHNWVRSQEVVKLSFVSAHLTNV